MQYESPKDLSEFTDKVKLGIDLDDTYFSFKTIGRIAPSLYNSTLGLMLNGAVRGPVADLRSRNLSATSESGNTHVELGVRMTGLPDIRETMSVVEIEKCYTTSREISRIVAGITGRGEIAWRLGVGREGGEAKLLHFKDGDPGMTAVGFMDAGNTRRNKLVESHFGWIPPK